MDLRRMDVSKVLTSLRERSVADAVGPAGVAIGIVLVALGWILEEESIGIGSTIRALGGIVLFAGLATVVFGDPHRRAVVTGKSKRIVERYMARTANWGWPDRVGLAGVAIGAALVVPAVVLQVVFRNGAIVALPAVILFWIGVLLLIYGRLHGRGEMRTPDRSSSPSRRGRHGNRRL